VNVFYDEIADIVYCAVMVQFVKLTRRIGSGVLELCWMNIRAFDDVEEIAG
jgi:hypothetical protein